MDTPPKDPQSSKYLVYGVDINNRQYQIAAAMESSFALNEEDRNLYLTTLLDQAIPLAYAAGKQVARVAGSYQGVVRVGTTLYNTPSLIFFSGGTFSVAPSPIDLANTNTRLITNNGENLPYLN